MKFLKSRARFLLPIALLAGTYAVSGLHPNVATKKPEIAAPKPTLPNATLPDTYNAPVPVNVISSPPDKPVIYLTVEVKPSATAAKEPVAVSAAPESSSPTTQPQTPTEPQKQPEPEPSVIDNVISTVTDILPL